MFAALTAAALQVQYAGAQGIPEFAQSLHALLKPRIQQSEQQTVQRRGIPPALHIALAHAQRALREHPGMEMRIV